MKLECEQNCPFAKLCGKMVQNGEPGCMQMTTNAMPGVTSVLPSASKDSEVFLMSGPLQIGTVQNGTIFPFS